MSAPQGESETMRLDLFLKRTRLVKRRTMIKKMCEAGLIQVNDATVAKPSKTIRAGDTIRLRASSLVRVKEIPSEKSVKDPGRWYEIMPADGHGANHDRTD